MKNLILIGISGSGKTYFGNRLSEKISKEFIDLDKLVSREAGASISDIFRKEGEGGFRQRESEAIKSISKLHNRIIATGGGAVLSEKNMENLSQNGIMVFLDRSVEDILGNVEMTERPLLRNNPEKLKDIYKERLPLYNKYADFIIGGGLKDKVLHELTYISTLESERKNLAVIGYPIDHSLSPPIHIGAIGPFLKELKYEREEVKKDGLLQWMKARGRMKFNGFNVTMPHKESIVPLLDEVDLEAEKIGSVNTVVNSEGELKGYNTDGEGFSSALKSKGIKFAGSIVTIIGSGGAGKALAMKAAEEDAKEIHIIARNPSKALEISRMTSSYYGVSCNVHPFPIEDIREGPWNSDIAINATPLGMKGSKAGFADYNFLKQFKRSALICDIVYSEEKTRLTLEAEDMGFKTLEGLEMLIEQALVADSLFLGAEINREKARKRAKEYLKGGPMA